MKPNSMWGKGRAHIRLNPERFINEDRMTMQRIGPHSPCIPRRGAPVNPSCGYHLGLRRDSEPVSVIVWLSRRREQHGWKNGAKVYKQ